MKRVFWCMVFEYNELVKQIFIANNKRVPYYKIHKMIEDANTLSPIIEQLAKYLNYEYTLEIHSEGYIVYRVKGIE